MTSVSNFVGCVRDAVAKRRRASAALIQLSTALLVAMLFTASAHAQFVTITPNPTTYSAEGNVINFNYALDPGSYNIQSINPATTNVKGVTVSCPPIPSGGTSQTINCTGSYSVDAFDMQSGQFRDTVTLRGTRTGGTFEANSNNVQVTRAGGGPTTLSVSSSPNPSDPNGRVTVTAIIGSQGCNSGLAPTGQVSLTIGSTTSNAPITIVNSYDTQGTASFQTTLANVGSYPVSASYAGGNGCSAASATGADHVVRQPVTAAPVVTAPANGATVNSTNPTYSGTAPVSSTVTVYVDNTSVGTTTATGGGTFNFTQPTALSQGSHTIRATAQSSGLAVSPSSNSNTFTVTILPPNANSQSVSVAYQTATAITLTGSDSNSPPRSLTYSVNTVPAHGTLSGTAPNLTYTPTANYSGSDSFTFTTSNGARTSSPATVSFTVNQPTITVSPASLPDGTVGAAFSQTLGANGGNGAYSYAIASGALPAGLTLSTSGILSGTPTAGGSQTFTVRATDASGAPGPYSGQLTYTLNVAAPTISLAPASVPDATTRVAYSQTLSASGGTATYTYAVTAGALPAGMTLSSNGILSGTANTAGSYSFTVTARLRTH